MNDQNLNFTGLAELPDSIAELREMVTSLEAQLVTLYEEKEEIGDRPADAGAEASGESHDDKVLLGARQIAALEETVAGLDEQLRSLYEERSAEAFEQSQVHETLTSLTDQLHALYEERELSATVTPSGSLALEETVRGLEEQLHALYAEREAQPHSTEEAAAMVASLTDRVAVLLAERDALTLALQHVESKIADTKIRARRLMGAMIDEILA